MVMHQIGDFTITEFVDVAAYFRNSGLLDYRLEDLQDFTLNSSQEESEITGKNGRPIGKKKKFKRASGSGTSGLISPGLMHTQTGGDIKYGKVKVKREESKPASGKGTTIVTDAVAVGTKGKEIGQIKLFGKGGMLVGVYEQGTTVSEDKFSYDPTTKTISLPNNNNITAGLRVVYAYDREVTATTINNPSDKFSKTRELWVHCYAKDHCDTIYRADLYIPRADFKGDFDTDLGGDQTTHNFSFDALPDFCNLDGDNDLYKWFIYVDDEVPIESGEDYAGGSAANSGIGDNHNDVFATDDEVKNVFGD